MFNGEFKPLVALIGIILLAGCASNEIKFSKAYVSTRIVAISDVGEFEGTIESYIVGDLDVPYYVMSIPMSDVSFDAVLNSSDDVNTTSSLRGNKTVYNVYEGLVKDENILSLFTYFDGHLYQIGTDSVKRDLNAFNELFDYYFKKN